MSHQWANIGEDLGALPALVRSVEDHIAISNVDFLWIFPTRRIAVGESTVLVIAAYDEDPDRRRVITAHFTVSRNKRGEPKVNARFDERGAAPEAAVPRIVQGVLRREGEDTEAEPAVVEVRGSVEAWDENIRSLGGLPRQREDAPDDQATPDTTGVEGAAAPPADDTSDATGSQGSAAPPADPSDAEASGAA